MGRTRKAAGSRTYLLRRSPGFGTLHLWRAEASCEIKDRESTSIGATCRLTGTASTPTPEEMQFTCTAINGIPTSCRPLENVDVSKIALAELQAQECPELMTRVAPLSTRRTFRPDRDAFLQACLDILLGEDEVAMGQLRSLVHEYEKGRFRKQAEKILARCETTEVQATDAEAPRP